MSQRPIYETPEDITHEVALAEALALRWSCQVLQLPEHYRVDFIMVRERKKVAWMEFKCRTNAMNYFPDYLISKRKWDDAISLSQCTGFPFLHIVKWSDGKTGLIEPKQYVGRCDVATGGRMDRKDLNDVEPCYFVPIEFFKLIEV